MGNHDLGRMIGAEAQIAYQYRVAGETALEILDRVCVGRGGDAEFEAEDPENRGHVHPFFNDYRDPCPAAGLGMLMVEAFAPNGLTDLPKYQGVMGYTPTNDPSVDEELAAIADRSSDLWYEEVCRQFNSRYKFW